MSDLFDDDYWPTPSKKNQEAPMEVVQKSASPEPVSAASSSIANDLSKIGKLSPKKFEECVKSYVSCSEVMQGYYNERFNSTQETVRTIVNAQVQIQNSRAIAEAEREKSYNELEGKRVEAQKELELAQKELEKYKMDHEERMKILNDYNTTFEKKFEEIKKLIQDTLEYSKKLRVELDKDKKKKFYEITLEYIDKLEDKKINLINQINAIELYKQQIPSLPESK